MGNSFGFSLLKAAEIPVVITEGGFSNIYYITITSQHITDGFINLPSSPSNPLKVILDVVQGSPQEPGVDFQISGSTLTFEGFPLESLLQVNDKIRIAF